MKIGWTVEVTVRIDARLWGSMPPSSLHPISKAPIDTHSFNAQTTLSMTVGSLSVLIRRCVPLGAYRKTTSWDTLEPQRGAASPGIEGADRLSVTMWVVWPIRVPLVLRSMIAEHSGRGAPASLVPLSVVPVS